LSLSYASRNTPCDYYSFSASDYCDDRIIRDEFTPVGSVFLGYTQRNGQLGSKRQGNTAPGLYHWTTFM